MYRSGNYGLPDIFFQTVYFISFYDYFLIPEGVDKLFNEERNPFRLLEHQALDFFIIRLCTQ